jgi:sulfur-oxidizing protein SoxY
MGNWTRRGVVLAGALAGVVMGRAAWAVDDDAARAARWHELAHAVFGDRPLHDGAGMVALSAPDRALNAALVPLGVTLAKPAEVKALYVFIDANPSPLVGTFHFGPAIDPRELKIRVRVEQYSLLHAVAETQDGTLYVAERFIKAAGGCSAPAGSNEELALKEMGRMKLNLLSPFALNQPDRVELLIRHPNNNGMQMDQITRNYIPARYIQTVRVTYNDRLVFDLDTDISLSEDPAFTFDIVPDRPGTLAVHVEDSKKTVFERSFPLPPAGT